MTILQSNPPIPAPVATAPPAQLPPAPREHLASPVTQAALRIQNALLAGAREYLAGEGFVELLPPVIGPVTDPGARGAKQVDVDYYGHRYKMMTSSILYKQASLTAFDKIFYVAPNVRLEPPETATTGRHLAEFHQLDVEIAGGRRADAMKVAEQVLVHAVGRVVDVLPEALAALGRDPDAFAALRGGSFGAVSHAQAVAGLIEHGHPQNPDAEIDWAGERILSAKSDRPFFITDYPKGSRGFYDREDPERPGVLNNFDLILPEGFGEISSGSERESDYGRIVGRIRETGENPAKYGWYLDLVRAGIPHSAGFGIGIERLTRYVAGLAAIWQATAFPKLPGVVAP
ncbi:MAG TPA: asparagine synthetase A [Actinocrinis sp.]|nr:asparagine synthetase A [Actinocrinis sp.]